MSKKNTKVNVSSEAIEVIKNGQDSIEVMDTLLARVKELEEALAKAKQDNETLVKAKAAAGQGSERKSQVLELLKERGPISIKGMATVLNTTTRNVSSVLTGLRNNGYVIHTDGIGQKYLVEEPETTTVA